MKRSLLTAAGFVLALNASFARAEGIDTRDVCRGRPVEANKTGPYALAGGWTIENAQSSDSLRFQVNYNETEKLASVAELHSGFPKDSGFTTTLDLRAHTATEVNVGGETKVSSKDSSDPASRSNYIAAIKLIESGINGDYHTFPGGSTPSDADCSQILGFTAVLEAELNSVSN